MFGAHGEVQVTGCRRRRIIVAARHVEDYQKDETTVNLTQGDKGQL
jgi:hypothetical protein